MPGWRFVTVTGPARALNRSWANGLVKAAVPAKLAMSRVPPAIWKVPDPAAAARVALVAEMIPALVIGAAMVVPARVRIAADATVRPGFVWGVVAPIVIRLVASRIGVFAPKVMLGSDRVAPG